MKVPPEFHERLEAAAKLTGIPKATLAHAAIEAAVASIERRQSVVFPMKFDVMAVPELAVVPGNHDVRGAVVEVGGKKLVITAQHLLDDAKRRHAARESSDKRDDSQTHVGTSP